MNKKDNRGGVEAIDIATKSNGHRERYEVTELRDLARPFLGLKNSFLWQAGSARLRFAMKNEGIPERMN